MRVEQRMEEVAKLLRETSKPGQRSTDLRLEQVRRPLALA